MPDNNQAPLIRHDWSKEEVKALLHLPFADLLLQAQQMHRRCFVANEVKICSLLSIKTGNCPEDCAYCPQSGHYRKALQEGATPITPDSSAHNLLAMEDVIAAARQAKEAGASRFCVAAAWRSPPTKAMPKLVTILREIKALGLETCASLGMLSAEQIHQLEEADLDFYNHNIDSSKEFYEDKITTTRSYQDRLDTVGLVRNSKIKVCCGGILGMGENEDTRIDFLLQLANMPQHPESVPLNLLIKIPGTPLENAPDLHPIDFVRTVAAARIMMPKSFVRLSAGRSQMSDEMQALAFFAGANSIHSGKKLLVTPTPGVKQTEDLFDRLGIKPLVTTE